MAAMASRAVCDEDTERLFGMAANHMITVKGLSLSSDQRLELYGLFKQATEGDCEDPKPGLIDLVGRAKWGAWNRLRGMEPVEAMKCYLLKVTGMCPDWLEQAKGQPPGDAGMVTEEDMKRDLQWEGSDKEENENGAGLAFGVTVSTLAAGEGNTADWGANEEIFAAASDGNVARLEDLVSRGARVDAKDDEMRTPLHFAADRGHPQTISTLLALGAAVDPRDADGMTPLAYAVACENEEEIKVLVQAGANVNSADNDGCTPISSAEEKIKHLLLLRPQKS